MSSELDVPTSLQEKKILLKLSIILKMKINSQNIYPNIFIFMEVHLHLTQVMLREDGIENGLKRN